MLINVFSLHRTGSTWWTEYISSQYPGSDIQNEVFNQLTYFKMNEKDYTLTPFETYEKGLCWRAPDESCTEIVYNFREITNKDSDRFDRWLKFLDNKDKIYVCHTHITPIQDEKYLTELSKIGDKNYYVYRENIFEQIASYILLKHTQEYRVNTSEEANKTEKYTYPIIDIPAIEWMCYEILRADKLVEDKLVNIERIRYESMPFEKTLPGMPLKQSVSAFDRLSIIDQTLIKQIYNRMKNGS